MLFKTSQEYQIFLKKCQANPKVKLVFQWANSPSLSIQQYRSIVDTQKLHGLELTKYPAVRNGHQNAPKRFPETSREYQIFFEKRKAIPKINLFSSGQIFRVCAVEKTLHHDYIFQTNTNKILNKAITFFAYLAYKARET